MTVRPGVTVSNLTVLTGIGRIAEMINLHASVYGGDRTTNRRGSFDRSEHRIDTGGKGAADFHLFNPDGTQVNDATAAKLVLEAGGVPEGTRRIYHGPQTNTQAEHSASTRQAIVRIVTSSMAFRLSFSPVRTDSCAMLRRITLTMHERNVLGVMHFFGKPLLERESSIALC